MRATDLARRMVWECGMGERFGALAIAPGSLAGDGSTPPWSEATVAAIDHETRAIVADGCHRATNIVTANAQVLEARATELGTVESLEGDALHRFLCRVRGSSDESLAQEYSADVVPTGSDLALVS